MLSRFPNLPLISTTVTGVIPEIVTFFKPKKISLQLYCLANTKPQSRTDERNPRVSSPDDSLSLQVSQERIVHTALRHFAFFSTADLYY